MITVVAQFEERSMVPIVQELDESKSLQMVDKIGPFVRTSVAERLRSPAFAEAMWAVVQETGEAVPSLRQGMTSKVDMVQLLQFAADGIWFVQRLYTRFFMLPGHIDVTRRSDKSSSLLLLGDEVSENGHRVFEFVDKSKDRLLIAQPPECVTVPDLLAIVVSRLIGSPVSLPIGALFLVPAGTELGVLHMLRQGSNVSSNEGTKNSIKNSGVPGMELLGSDTVLVQCHPLRPFHSGEIVAWRTDGQGSMRYGRVMHDARASAGQALYRLEVETGPGEIRILLSSQVFFFKGTTAASPSAVSLETQRDVNAGVSSLTGASQPHHHRLAPETAGPGSRTAAQKKVCFFHISSSVKKCLALSMLHFSSE
jgi:sacsin